MSTPENFLEDFPRAREHSYAANMAASLRNCLICSFRSVAQNSWFRFHKNEQNYTKILFRSAGHSHWQNIKFKKMHADFARSKLFGRLALEMITAVRGK